MNSKLLQSTFNSPHKKDMFVVPAKYFSSYLKSSSQDGDTKVTTDKEKASDPTVRFLKRNDFMKRRHLQRDHIIRAQHYDIRVSAIRASETVKEAVNRHSMIAEEARLWAGFAVNTVLYASFLRGEERVKVETATYIDAVVDEEFDKNRTSVNELDNRLYLEAFAVGEIRGYCNFEQLKMMKHRMLFPQIPQDSENISLIGGKGMMRVSKTLYNTAKSYTTTIESNSHTDTDWNLFYGQSEQIPSFVHTVTAVNDNPLDKVIGVDSEGNFTGNSINEAPAPVNNNPYAYLTIAEDDVDFVGGVVIQVLAGNSDPELRQEILNERALLKASKSEDIAVQVKNMNLNQVEETDEEYVKRVQLERLQEKAKSLDMKSLMSQYGVAGYVAVLLGEDVEAIANRHTNPYNVTNDIDFESMERDLIDSAVRTRNVPDAEVKEENDIVSQVVQDVQEKVCLKHEHHFQYRPVHFFCRCYQTKIEEKLGHLPINLLEELIADEGASFTCDLCNTTTEVTVPDLQTAVDLKKSLKN